MSMWFKHLINTFFIAMRGLVLFMFSGLILMQISCQTDPIKKEPDIELTTRIDKSNDDPQQGSKFISKNNKLPNIPLTEKILFKYILGELAIQHKDYKTAFNNFMSLSHMTRDPRIAKYALRIALMSGNDLNILQAVQLWSELEQSAEPSTIDIAQIKAIILLKINQDKLAIQSLLDILKQENVEQAMPNIGVILSSLNDYSRVKNIFLALSAAYKNNYYVNLYRAKFALRFNDYPQTEESINKALQIEAKNETAYLLKSLLYKKMGQIDKAVIVYKNAIELLDKPSLIRLEYANVLLEKNQREAVIEQLEYIIAENDTDNHVLYSIGMLAMDIKKYEHAKIFFTKLYQLKGYKDQGAFLLGVAAYGGGENDRALHWFDKITGKKYKYESLLRKIVILSEQKRYKMAIDVLDSYVTSDTKKQLNILRLKAEILNQAELYKKAYDTYSDALHIYPKNIRLLYGRAMVAEKQGRIDLSEKDLLSIIKDNPKNSNALNALGFILTEKTTRYNEAKKHIKKALEIKPDDMAIIDSMGWVLYKLGKIQESLVYLKQAYDMEQDPEIAAHYGEVLWIFGQKKQAKQIWQSTLIKHPEHELLNSTMTLFLTP